MSGTVKNQKQENLSKSNLEDILIKSINQAKQKAYFLDQLSTDKSTDKSSQYYDKTHQRQSYGEVSRKKQTGAFVGAMKTLQNKISQLTADNEQYKSQLEILKKRYKIDAKTQTLQLQYLKQKDIWEDEKRCMRQALSEQKSYIIELEQRIKILVEENETAIIKLLSVNKTQKDSFPEKNLKITERAKQLEQRQENLKKLQEQTFLTAMKLNSSVTQNIENQRQLENQMTKLRQKNQQYQHQVKSLKLQLQQQRIRIKVLLKAIPANDDKQNIMIQADAAKVKSGLVKNRKKSSNISQTNITYKNYDIALSAENRSLLQKNQQMYFELKKSNEKNRFLLRDLKQWKSKYHQLKKLTDQVTEIIYKIPSNFQSTFKNVIARIRKLQGTHLQNLRSKSRSTRVLSNGVLDRSPNKSRNRLKPLKMSDLNTSDLTSRSRSRSHSKKVKNYTFSSQKKSKSKTIIQKAPIAQQIKNLQKRITQMKKQYLSIINNSLEQEKADKTVELLSQVVTKLQLFQNEKQLLVKKQKNKQQICVIDEI